MVLRLAEHLDVPVRERNALLVSAGHSPQYTETPIASPALASLRADLERMVRAYEPYPALVVDGTYQVLAANASIGMLLEGVAPHLLRPPLNAMRITLHPEGLAPHILNFREWRGICCGRWNGSPRCSARRRCGSCTRRSRPIPYRRAVTNRRAGTARSRCRW